ncbi:DUF2235 domain-containing protein [Paracoccus lutimaris]|uniref:Putative alpha/beta hydrolase family protein DUF2235 n=1 Tax=Paracoccus lutimaris TaxID=1490030 RepID=A0A368YCH5_9RHOB|nr:DUF2235 domain-containing protein [Paracoccus lutimaris]RCW77960.1 putative alpha/beta hydrolase family protein DUF2235 [Paracoccus lutimaris]
MDTVAVGCELLRVGMFFDGTGNSRDHVPVGGVTWHTNVDLLERIYLPDQGKIEAINGQSRKVSYSSIYMRGIGVRANSDGDDFLGWYGLPREPRVISGGKLVHIPSAGIVALPTGTGLGWGAGPEGVESRVLESYVKLESYIRKVTGGIQPCDIWLDVFGFSRGAVAARDFANGVKDQEFSYGSTNIRTKFLGLFDKVSFMGSGGNTGNHEGVYLNTSGNVSEIIVHITAKDEIRRYFPLTLTMSGERIEMVGSHSDIGGGYLPNSPPSTFYFTDMAYPGVRKYFESRWGLSMQYVVSNDKIDVDGDFIIRGAPGDFESTSETIIQNTADHGLQFVSLRLMHDRAVSAGVPFRANIGDSIDGKSIGIDKDLDNYYRALCRNDINQAEILELEIRKRYAHISFNNETNRGVSPNLPEPDAVRKVASL